MPSVSIVGLGPWGLCALERLVAASRRAPSTETVVHIVEPGTPGGGMYSARHPDYLVLNTPCGQHSLYPFPAEEGEGRHGLGFYEWACARGYHWEGLECKAGEPGPDSRPITPYDFLPRRVMGEYLEWFYEVLCAEAPPNLEIRHHQVGAADIERLASGRERVLLADGSAIVVDHVILTLGHARAEEADGSANLVTAPYPIEGYLSEIQPGEKVAVEGMGLVAVDVITALTIGLGGRFVEAEEGRLRYLPSGREPSLYLFSRSGYPYCAKPFGAADPVGDYRPAICTVEAIARLKGAPGPKRQMDARSELLPLVFAEMELCYYTQAAQLKAGKAAAARVKARLLSAWAEGTFIEERGRLAKRYGTFVARDHFFVGEGAAYRDSGDYQARVCATVSADMREALVEGGTPVKAGLETLRALRDTLRFAVEFKGLTFESHLDFVANMRNRFARLVAGPPVFRSQQLLALVDAGVVKMPFGPRPEVLPLEGGRAAIRSMHLHEPVEIVVDRFIRGHLDIPSLGKAGSPLIDNLVARGRMRSLSFDGLPAGSVDLSEDFHPVNADGEAERRLWLFGVLTEGARYFTLYIPSPKSRVRAFLDAGVAVDEILARSQTVVLDATGDGVKVVLPLGGGETARPLRVPRPLRVALVNNMPDGAFEETERQFRALLAGDDEEGVEISCHSLAGVPRSPKIARLIRDYYGELGELWSSPPDVLVVTGAEPKHAELSDELYWPALEKLLWWGRAFVPNVLVSCLTAHAALWAFDGLPRRLLLEKCSGVFPQAVDSEHPLTSGIDMLALPHSRFNEVPTKDLEEAGYRVLSRSGDAGWAVAVGEKDKCQLLLLQGHPEYAPLSLLREYRRDVRRYLTGEQGSYPHLPKGYLDSEGLEALERFELWLSGLPRGPAFMDDFPFDFAAAHVNADWQAPARALLGNWLRMARRRADARSGGGAPSTVAALAAPGGAARGLQ